MAEIDTSIYKPTTQPPNLLTQFGQAAGIQNALNQSQLFQTEFADRAALSKAYEGVPFDPSTGAPDMNALTQRFKDAGIQRLLPEALGKAQDLQSKGLALRNTQVDLATKAIGAQRQVLGTLAAKGGNFTDAEATNAIAEIYPILKQVPGAVDNAISEIVKLKGLKTPEERHEFVQTHLLNTMSAQERVNAIYGAPTMIDTGGQIQPTAVSAFTGKATPIGGPFTKTLSPGEATAPTSVLIRNPDGTFTPSTVTRSQFANMAGQGPVAQAPALSPLGLTPSENLAQRPTFENGQPGVRTTENVLTQQGYPARPGSRPGENAFGVTLAPPSAPAPSGFVPPAAAPPSSAAAPAPAAKPAAPATGFVPTGPKLGAPEAAAVTGQQSATQGVELQRTADAVPQRKAILGNLEGALDQFTSGPGADWQKVAKSAVNKFNPFGDIFDPKSIASQEEFAKQSYNLAQAQFQALGGTGTDAKLNSTMHTSPSEFLSKYGNKGIIQILKGNEDAVTAKNQAWQSWLASGHGPETYGQFSTEFNKAFDPRVFQAQYMGKTEKADLVKAMSPTERDQFRANVAHALEMGWVKVPSAAPAQ